MRAVCVHDVAERRRWRGNLGADIVLYHQGHLALPDEPPRPLPIVLFSACATRHRRETCAAADRSFRVLARWPDDGPCEVYSLHLA